MASLLIGAGILSYEAIKKSRAKRAQKKALTTTTFSDLERDNASRTAHLQGHETCSCQTSDWTGGGCDIHGYVPAAGEPVPAPEYTEVDTAGAVREGTRRDQMPVYEDAGEGYGRTKATTTRVSRESQPDYRYRRGEEDGALAGRKGPPRPMGEDEIRRINEERRKRMNAGGFSNWVSKRKGRGGSSNADAVVR